LFDGFGPNKISIQTNKDLLKKSNCKSMVGEIK
jgi:hypothetical protein